MSSSSNIRKVISLAAVFPLTVFGLAACAGGESIENEREREPRTTTAEGSDSEADAGAEANGSGGGLPFPFPGGSNSEADGSGASGDASGGTGGNASGNSDSGGSDAGGSGGGAGTETVTVGDLDMSSVDWDVSCMPADDELGGYVLGSNASGSGEYPDASFTITTDEKGTPDFISLGDGSYESGGYASWMVDLYEGGSLDLSIDGDQVVATGEAFDIGDYSESNPLPFEVRVTCDRLY